ncbi:MAG: hypothetical protein V7640_3867 [Betaproteobacteria bacterium]
MTSRAVMSRSFGRHEVATAFRWSRLAMTSSGVIARNTVTRQSRGARRLEQTFRSRRLERSSVAD